GERGGAGAGVRLAAQEAAGPGERRADGHRPRPVEGAAGESDGGGQVVVGAVEEGGAAGEQDRAGPGAAAGAGPGAGAVGEVDDAVGPGRDAAVLGTVGLELEGAAGNVDGAVVDEGPIDGAG